MQKLWDQSAGGFGAMLLLGHEWANPEATNRSWELVAQHVMPAFQGHAQDTLDAAARATGTRDAHAATRIAAVEHMTARYQQELAGKG